MNSYGIFWLLSSSFDHQPSCFASSSKCLSMLTDMNSMIVAFLFMRKENDLCADLPMITHICHPVQNQPSNHISYRSVYGLRGYFILIVKVAYQTQRHQVGWSIGHPQLRNFGANLSCPRFQEPRSPGRVRNLDEKAIYNLFSSQLNSPEKNEISKKNSKRDFSATNCLKTFRPSLEKKHPCSRQLHLILEIFKMMEMLEQPFSGSIVPAMLMRILQEFDDMTGLPTRK